MGLAFSEVSSTAYQEGHDDTATFIGAARETAASFGWHVARGVSVQIQNVSSPLGVLHCHALRGGMLLP